MKTILDYCWHADCGTNDSVVGIVQETKYQSKSIQYMEYVYINQAK